MNIYMSRPPMVATQRTLREFVTAIHLDVRELTEAELSEEFPDGLPADEETGEPLTAWTCTDYFLHHDTPHPDADKVRQTVLDHVNAKTDAKILTGYSWNGKPVYLSSENQFNFKAAYDVAVQNDGAILPVKFKLGEDDDGNPVYHTFRSMNTFREFYTGAIGFIQATLAEGWIIKDALLVQLNATPEP